MKRRQILGLGLTMCATPYVRAASTWQDDLDAALKDGMGETGTPGMSVAIIRAGQPNFVRSYGYANVASNVAVTPDTAFHIASVSKVVTGTALLMLMEKGAYKLDDPVAPLLDFPLAHPKFADTPITFRHLFNHTSGISDALYNQTKAFALTGDPAMSLHDFLRGYLAPGGHWYASEAAFTGARPGREREYSNVAIALLGYLAGRVGKDTLDTFTRQKLFQPLDMRNTAWKLAELDAAKVALPYGRVDGKLQALAPTGYPDWPAGLLRTSARDFAPLMQVFCNRGSLDGRRYLEVETLKLCFTPQPIAVDEHIGQGLIWELREKNGVRLASHFGSDPGAASFVCLDLEQHLGLVCFANITGDESLRAFQKDVLVRLLKQARAS